MTACKLSGLFAASTVFIAGGNSGGIGPLQTTQYAYMA
jgi:hypothetical protein